MDLSAYDVIVVNTSGGKDSQTALRLVHRLAAEQGVSGRLVAVHADLGRVEWPGTAALAERQARHYGVRFIKVRRPQGDLLDHVEARGMWPSSTTRYCTSDHKRGQVAKVITQLVDEVRARRPGRVVRVLSVFGFRAEESAARAKKPVLARDTRLTNSKRTVDTWLPILEWSTRQVWADIRSSGVEHHPAYDAGMPRLSCSFCVLASRSALVLAAQLRPDLAAEYQAVEQRTGHRFTAALSMADIVAAAQAEAVAAVDEWAA